MSRGLLDPKVDFVFKNIFGSSNHPEILISFLNATLKPKKKIVSVDINKTDIEKQYIEDKYSRLDVKATICNEEIRQAKDELIRMSNDKKQRELYDMRANSLRDKISELNAVEKKGREEGIQEGRKETAKNLLKLGVSIDVIIEATGLSKEDIDKIR